ncbi:hypothetical protein pipiens_000096, partial [Culex pipiens pipiens]
MDELDEFNEAPHVVHRGLGDSDSVLRVACDDDYPDDEDEIETLVLSTDDLLNSGSGDHPPTIVSTGGSKPLVLNGRSRNHL